MKYCLSVQYDGLDLWHTNKMEIMHQLELRRGKVTQTFRSHLKVLCDRQVHWAVGPTHLLFHSGILHLTILNSFNSAMTSSF